ncbi:MAG TPA: hypothetical protein VJM15_10355 [Sphingomicrobium sp.]|nr:hypothetical protein [Sphingomicrobium sp.]
MSGVQPTPPGLPPGIFNEVANVATNAAEPVPAPARFALQAPPKVEAGNSIRVEIKRVSRDGKPHNFRLDIEPAALIASRPGPMIIEDSAEGWTGEVVIVEEPPTDVRRELSIVLVPLDGGEPSPRQATVTIVDPASFTVRAPDGAVNRGDTVTFTISRQGGVGPRAVGYSVTQGATLVGEGERRFDEGGAPQTVDIAEYDTCDPEPLALTLTGVAGSDTDATAAFSGYSPPDCGTPPPPPWPWWWALVPVPPAAGLTWWYFRRRRRRRWERKRERLLPDLRAEYSCRFGDPHVSEPLPLRFARDA